MTFMCIVEAVSPLSSNFSTSMVLFAAVLVHEAFETTSPLTRKRNNDVVEAETDRQNK